MGYYEVLEVDKKANGDLIRKQYSTLAEKFHPRRFLEPNYNNFEPFKMLSEAYDVLCHPFLRSVYDTSGVTGLNDALRCGKITHPLSMMSDFCFSDTENSSYMLNRAEKLFEDVWSKEKPELVLDKSDDLLKTNDFEKICQKYSSSKDVNIVGDSYQKSTITKDGKTVEIIKKSILKPDGTLQTEVTEEYDDGKGKKDSRTLTNTEKWRHEVESEKKGGPIPMLTENKQKSTQPMKME
jgi:DnaJ-class molecular chaperone